LLESAKSPVRLETSAISARRSRGKSTRIWARAPAYAWGSADTEEGRGGESLLVLDRAATLEVSIEGEKRSRDLIEPASILVYLPPTIPGGGVAPVVQDI